MSTIDVTWARPNDIEPKGVCNSNNHWDLAPASFPKHDDPAQHEAFMEMYEDACNPFNFTNWAEAIKMPGVVIVPLDWKMVRDMSEAAEAAVITREPPRHLAEELSSIAEHISRSMVPGTTYFVRLDACSAKDVTGRPLPARSGRDVVNAIVCSKRCEVRLNAMRKARACGRITDDKKAGAAVVLLPWREDINPLWEFRVFAPEGRVAAVSQYEWFQDGGWSAREELLPHLVDGICALHAKLAPRLPFSSCVMDVHARLAATASTDAAAVEPALGGLSLDGDPSPVSVRRGPLVVELVEFNPFGAHLSSGSALFHWQRDWDALHGVSGRVALRLFRSD